MARMERGLGSNSSVATCLACSVFVWGNWGDPAALRPPWYARLFRNSEVYLGGWEFSTTEQVTIALSATRATTD